MREPVPAPLTRRPRLALLAAPVAAALLLAGCGGNDDDPAPATSPTPTPSVTATPTPTPTPTASSSPVAASGFEDRAPVKAVRKWAAAVGKAVNAHDTSMSSISATATANGREVTAQVVASDLDKKYTWPGPQPLTPVSVKVSGGSADVTACYLTRGWSVDPATGDRVTKKKVEAAKFTLAREDGRWKVDGVYSGKADCGGVDVPEVLW
jgi:hypothetical protein